MSWSFHNRPATRRPARLLVARLLAAGAAMAGGTAFAAQVFVQPSASLTAENDSNLDLDPTGANRNVQGYLAGVGSVFGISTRVSEVTIRPRLEYRYYPKDPLDNRLEEFLDFNSNYRGLRSAASIFGRMDHQDDFNAEFSSALYDSFNPVQPTAPQTGKAVIGETRDSVLLMPKYDYRLSPRLAAGVSGVYQSLRYSAANVSNHVDFDYYLGEAFLSWSTSARSTLSFGGYGSKYKATQIDSRATGTGGSFGFDTNWTQLLSTSFSAVYQRTSVDTTIPSAVRADVNSWGATFGAVYKAQVTKYRLDIGRIITPSGGGGVYVNDQVQFQYNRQINERLAFTGAVIALRNHGISSNARGNGRDYVQSVLELQWNLSPTWFLQGGYQYGRQKYQANPDGAVNNRIYIRFGYLGLGQQW